MSSDQFRSHQKHSYLFWHLSWHLSDIIYLSNAQQARQMIKSSQSDLRQNQLVEFIIITNIMTQEKADNLDFFGFTPQCYPHSSSYFIHQDFCDFEANQPFGEDTPQHMFDAIDAVVISQVSTPTRLKKASSDSKDTEYDLDQLSRSPSKPVDSVIQDTIILEIDQRSQDSKKASKRRELKIIKSMLLKYLKDNTDSKSLQHNGVYRVLHGQKRVSFQDITRLFDQSLFRNTFQRLFFKDSFCVLLAGSGLSEERQRSSLRWLSLLKEIFEQQYCLEGAFTRLQCDE